MSWSVSNVIESTALVSDLNLPGLSCKDLWLVPAHICMQSEVFGTLHWCNADTWHPARILTLDWPHAMLETHEYPLWNQSFSVLWCPCIAYAAWSDVSYVTFPIACRQWMRYFCQSEAYLPEDIDQWDFFGGVLTLLTQLLKTYYFKQKISIQIRLTIKILQATRSLKTYR